MIDTTCDVECLLSFDLYHAFDSPPKLLIIQTLDKLGIPLPFNPFAEGDHHPGSEKAIAAEGKRWVAVLIEEACRLYASLLWML